MNGRSERRARLLTLAAGVGLVTGLGVLGVDPLLTVEGHSSLSAIDLLGAAAVGLSAGVGARLFALMLGLAGKIQGRGRSWLAPGRVLAAGAALAGLALLADAALGSPLTLGPGYDAIAWTIDADHGVWLVALLFVLRALATGVTVAGGGVGGTFIPLVVQGALLGRLIGFAFAAHRATLFTMVGVSAFVGAGYRTPLAGVTFVAESTGRPGFVVPGLIATVLAQLVIGPASVARFQRDRRGAAERGAEGQPG